MTKAGPCILCILQIALVHLGAQAQTLVSGVVQRADGSAVSGAAVAFYPFGPSRGIRPKGVTNDKGEYSLAITYVGPGLLSASRTDEGYPDAAIAFYSLRDYTSAREIDPEGAAIGNVRLRFGRPDPRLELSLHSKGGAVASVQVDVRSLANKDIYSIFLGSSKNLDFYYSKKSSENHRDGSRFRNVELHYDSERIRRQCFYCCGC